MKTRIEGKKPKLSLCMIVKDEEKYLYDCLKSVEDVVDEIIVVDTGSNDSTVAIAKEFHAEVFEVPWHEDFSAARNESIKHAKGDWILQLDADERLHPDSKFELRKWLNKKNEMCASVLIDSPEAANKNGHISRAHRLFRNVPGVCYSGRIHEQISPSIFKLNGKEGFSNIKVVHLGYAKDKDAMHEKSDRNLKLLKKQIAEDPNNAYWHFTLAQNQILRKQYSEALKPLQTALKLGGLPKDIRCSIYNNLAEVKMQLEEYPEAIQFAEKALAITRSQTMSYLLLYSIYERLDEPLKQIHCLEAAKDIIEKKAQAFNEVSLEAYVDPVAIYTNLANKYLKIEKIEQAKHNFEKALSHDSKNQLALRGFSDCFLVSNEFETACEILNELKTLRPDDPVILEKLGWLSIKLQDFDRAAQVYETLQKMYPENPSIIKRLAALYLKIGKPDKSKDCLMKLKSEFSIS